MLDDAFGRVRRERRPALRLWTSRRNVGAQALFIRDGFRRIATFTRMTAPSAAGKVIHAGDPVWSARGDLDAVWRQWQHGAACRSGWGYLEYRWHFVPLSRGVLKELLRRREVFARRGAVGVLWSEEGDTAAHGAVLAGGRTALQHIRRLAVGMRHDRVEVFLPDSPGLIRAARAAGFGPADWGREAILFERPNSRR